LSERRARRVDDVRVLSFGAFIAGNTSASILADLGADVVKIEARARPEVLRNPAYNFGTAQIVEPSGVPNTVMLADLAHSTRGLSLEMNTDAGRALFKRLVAVADVVIENFGEHTMRNWGCSFDDLTAVNPRLVMVSLSGYGRTGPHANYLAYASNISNATGLTATWGYQHGTHSDYITAAHAALAVLAALEHVDQSGTGVRIDIAQTEALGAVMAPIYLDALNNGRDTPPAHNDVPGSLFTGVFASRGHDRWLAIELEDVDDWTSLCTVLDRGDLRIEHERDADGARGALSDAVAAWAAERSPHTAAHVLQRAGLAAAPVSDTEDIVRDPQLRTRGAFVELAQPDIGPLEYAESPYRMTKTPGRARRAGPRLGEHTDEVLREWLGVDDAELTALERADAIFRAPVT
jgi:benzylsuccinate CoA-transferase BbsF subunit